MEDNNLEEVSNRDENLIPEIIESPPSNFYDQAYSAWSKFSNLFCEFFFL